jgi:hypothetical protein
MPCGILPKELDSSERVRDRLRGLERGSLTPRITLISHPRSFGGGEERLQALCGGLLLSGPRLRLMAGDA